MKFVLLLVFIAILGSPKVAYSSGEIEIAVTDSHPWAYLNDGGGLEGIYPDMFNRISLLSSNKFKIKVKVLPLKRILREMESDKSSLSFAIMSYKPKRAEIMEPLIPIYKTPFVLISHADRPLHKIEDIKDKDVSMLLGGSGCPCLDASLPYNKIRVNHHEQGLNMLQLGRVDAVAGPSDLADRLDILNVLAEPISYEWRTVWLWSDRQDKISIQHKRDLTKLLQQAINRGDFSRLTQQYLKSSQLKFLNPVLN